MSLTVRVLIGLVAGLVAGIAISVTGTPALNIVPFIEPVGTIWVNAIRMTVIPLVVASIVVGVASASDPKTIGRIGGRAVALFFAVLGGAAVLTVVIAPPLMSLLPVDPDGAAALRESAGGGVAERASDLPGFVDWLVGLVPINPIASAANDALLPLIVFSVGLGVATTHLTAERREVFIGFFQALADAMLTLVRWVLDLAPIGVFALALPLATRLGLGAAGAVAAYVLVVAGICLILIGAFYPVASLGGRVSLRVFAQATGPAQAVAFSSRSSLASLPAMMEGAEDRLGLPTEISSFFLTLSASVFRVGTVVAQIAGVLFIAHLYGIPLVPSQYASIALASVLTSFSVPAVPGGTILVMVPVLVSANLPVEAIGILLAVDTIPDMFRTAANVTGHMSLAALLGRGAPTPAAVGATAAAEQSMTGD